MTCPMFVVTRFSGSNVNRPCAYPHALAPLRGETR